MRFDISDKDQIRVKEAFSSLWKVCGNTWDNIFDDTSEEKIKGLEKEIEQLKEKSKEGKSLE